MRPDESNDRRVGKPLIQQRPLLYARSDAPQHTTTRTTTNREPAANIIRGQIHSIYDGNTHTPTPQTTPVHAASEPETPTPQKRETLPNVVSGNQPAHMTEGPAPTTHKPQAPTNDDLTTESPYDRTHSQTPRPQEEQWKQYHTAWQDYYKQYYERFYLHEINKAKQSTVQTQPTTTTGQQVSATGSGSTVATAQNNTPTGESVTKSEALNELREQVREKIRHSAKKVRKSRHFIPITAGVVVLLMFSFLQYNRTFFAVVNAYVAPGNVDPQNIIVDPTVAVQVGPEPKLIIPKINVESPVIYGIGPDHNSQMAAMEGGVAHFSIPGANSVPGQVGNTVIAGHSSNDVFAAGDYKFIFAQNEKLREGDVIYMNYESVRYTYRITSREVVMPNEVDKIILDTDKPMLTLISCVPLGTADKRLLIFAEQINPSPAGAPAAPQPATTTPDDAGIPGNEPTLLERIFGS